MKAELFGLLPVSRLLIKLLSLSMTNNTLVTERHNDRFILKHSPSSSDRHPELTVNGRIICFSREVSVFYKSALLLSVSSTGVS